MLTADALDALPQSVVDLYERYQQSVIEDIARRLANMDFESAAWQVQRLNQSAMLYDEIMAQLARTTGKSEAELKQIFQAAGVKAMKFDDSLYRLAGLSPLPFNQSPAMLDVLRIGLMQTNNTLQNLTRTTALTGQQAFLDAADLAHMQIATGAFDYTSAIKNAIIQTADRGLDVIHYAGKTDKLDVAVRRAVLTGVGQTAGLLTEARADQMGADLVQTSAHIGARNHGDTPENHAMWQGRVFSRSGNDPKYPNFRQVTGFGTGAGLGGWNCRHSHYPYFEGLSAEAYSQATLDEYAAKTVTYNGKEMSWYDATQEQRGIERQIRKWKRRAGAVKAGGLDNGYELGKVREWQARMRDFTGQTGIYRQPEREWVYTGKSKTIATPAVIQKPPSELAREKIKSLWSETDEKISNLKNEKKFFDDENKTLFDQLHQAFTDGDMTKVNEINDQIDSNVREMIKRNKAIEDLKNSFLPRVREDVLFVDNPSEFMYTKTKTAKRPEVKLGLEDFKRLVQKGLLPDNSSVGVLVAKSGRAYYSGQKIYITSYNGSRTVVHELGHWLEDNNPDVHRSAVEFLERRTKGEQLELLLKLTKNPFYGKNELARPDKFINPYMGKEYVYYGNRYATEIISMGMEYMYDDPVRFATEDPEYFDFIFNLLRGIFN